ncbi:MAG: hypothetical protein UY49_C0003G0008, partial [Microgenomates group bacterium GW2011_GWC1_49_7]
MEISPVAESIWAVKLSKSSGISSPRKDKSFLYEVKETQ